MEKTLQRQIERRIDEVVSYIGNIPTINWAIFFKIFQELQELNPSGFSLSEAQIKEIFSVLDHENTGSIKSQDVLNLVQEFTPTLMSFPQEYNRGSLYFDPSQKRFAYNPDELKNQQGNQRMARSAVQASPKKIASNVLNSLSLDKISELKFLYRLADPSNLGSIEFAHLMKVMKENQRDFSLTEFEVKSVFEAIKDEKTSKIQSDVFAKLLGELEKRIYNYFTEDSSSTTGNVDFSPFMSDKAEMNHEEMEVVHDSDSDLENEDDEENEYAQTSEGLGRKHVNFLLQTIDKFNSIKGSIKNQAYPTLVADLIKFTKILEKKFQTTEEKIDKLIKKLTEMRSKEDFTLAKVKSFEFDLKREYVIRETLQEENDVLSRRVQELENILVHKERDLRNFDNKNTEIVNLEDKIRRLDNDIGSYKRQIQDLERERNQAKENYRLLQEIHRKIQEEKDKESEVKTEEREEKKGSLNRENLILKAELELKESELTKLQESYEALLSALEEQRTSSEELIDKLSRDLREERKKYQMLQEDFDMKSDQCLQLSGSLGNAMVINNMRASQKIMRASVNTLGKEVNNGFGISIFDNRVSMFNKYSRNYLLIDDGVGIPEETQEAFRGSLAPGEKGEAEADSKDKEKKVLSHGFSFSDQTPPQDALPEEKKAEDKSQDNPKIRTISASGVQFGDVKDVEGTPNEAARQLLSKIAGIAGPRSIRNNNSKMSALKVPPGKGQDLSNLPPGMRREDVEYPFFQFDEASLFAKDYLGIREDPRIVKILKKYGEEMLDFRCYSDYMFRINHREHKEKRAVLITSQAFYNLHPRKDYEVIRRIKLEKIYRVSLSEKFAVLMGIHVRGEYDYLIETYRRTDLVLFLMETFKLRGLKQFDRIFSSEFSIKNRGAKVKKNIDKYDKTQLNPELQEAYKNSQKYGLLYLMTDSWWTPWKEYFFLLTNIGLLYFKKPGQKDPISLIPILGSSIIAKPSSVDKQFAFKILYQDNQDEVVLCAKSQAEKDEWINKLLQLQKEASKKLDPENLLK